VVRKLTLSTVLNYEEGFVAAKREINMTLNMNDNVQRLQRKEYW